MILTFLFLYSSLYITLSFILSINHHLNLFSCPALYMNSTILIFPINTQKIRSLMKLIYFSSLR